MKEKWKDQETEKEENDDNNKNRNTNNKKKRKVTRIGEQGRREGGSGSKRMRART